MSGPEVVPAYDAVVLCGGGSRRMGRDKPSLVHQGQTLLQVAVSAVVGAATTVCVGPRRDVADVTWVREDPVGAGPVAAVVATLPLLSSPVVVLLAADLPLVTPAAVASLVLGTRESRGAVAVDDVGREQWLLSAWDVDALRQAVAGATGPRLRDLLEPLRGRRLPLPGRPWLDCDTPEDWAELRRTDGRVDRGSAA